MKNGFRSLAVSLCLGFILPACGVVEEQASSTAAVSVPVQPLEEVLSHDQELQLLPPPSNNADLYAEIQTADGVLGVEIALADPAQGAGLTTVVWQPQTIEMFAGVDPENQILEVPRDMASMHLRDEAQRAICSTRKLVADTVLQSANGPLLATVGIGIGIPGGGGCALSYANCVVKPCEVLGLKGNCARGRHAFLPLKACVCFLMVVEPTE